VALKIFKDKSEYDYEFNFLESLHLKIADSEENHIIKLLGQWVKILIIFPILNQIESVDPFKNMSLIQQAIIHILVRKEILFRLFYSAW